jgi:hypothetical protein
MHAQAHTCKHTDTQTHGSLQHMQGEHLGQFMAAHPAKFKERVRKGIPEELRGLSWQLLSGVCACVCVCTVTVYVCAQLLSGVCVCMYVCMYVCVCTYRHQVHGTVSGAAEYRRGTVQALCAFQAAIRYSTNTSTAGVMCCLVHKFHSLNTHVIH